jgi:hypothetical protein
MHSWISGKSWAQGLHEVLRDTFGLGSDVQADTPSTAIDTDGERVDERARDEITALRGYWRPAEPASRRAGSTACEHGVEHRLGEALGERVLLAGMERADQRGTAVDRHLDTVAELRPRAHPEVRARGLVAELPEAHDHRHPLERRELALEERCAGVAFVRCRLVGGGAHLTAAVTHASVSTSPSSIATDSGWLASPARYIARNSQSPLRSPVNTRPVRFAPCAAGREAEHDDARVGVAESRDRATPVVLVAVRRPLLDRHLLTPVDEARAGPTRDHIAFEPGERSHGPRQ